jgi:nitrite reductase (NO-forming)
MLAELDVLGQENAEIYDPDAHGTSQDGPQYA